MQTMDQLNRTVKSSAGAALNTLREATSAAKQAAAPRLDAAADAARQVGRRASPSAWAMESMAAGVLSTAALMLLGRRENGSAYAPLNATSHIVWGDEAASMDEPDWKHTAVGQVLHHASTFFWGALFELLQARRTRPSTAGVITDAAVTTAVAAVVDLKLVPDRLTPGFEKRLSNTALAVTYGALAAGLVIGGMAALRRR
ncbi:hypothetical protein [Ideonella sp. BN130291]|uniref:hypothetical protein n=1 Tax=Ideonella sp. BN130291 TaxID=3112940 RepID=UPI002E25CD27|nr:hypothetical protein [Ideonella sp. BN130291]